MGAPARRRASRARRRGSCSSPGRCRSARRSPARARPAVRRAARHATRAGTSTTATSGGATTRASSSSSSASASPSRTRRSRSRTASAGASRPTPRRWSATAGRRRACDDRATLEALAAPRSAARRSSSTAPTTRISHVRHGRGPGRARSRALGSSRSRRRATSRTPATRSRVNLLIREFVASLRGDAIAPTGAGRRRVARARPSRRPDRHGRRPDGVRIAYEVYGAGDPTIVLLPVGADRPLAAVEGPGPVPQPPLPGRRRTTAAATAARTGRPTPEAYHDDRFVDDLEAVMDATGTPRAVLVGLCGDGVWRAIRLRGGPARTASSGSSRSRSASRGSSPPHPLASSQSRRSTTSCRPYEGWAKVNRHYWRRDYPDFAAVLLQRDHVRAALDEGDRGRRRTGRSTARSRRCSPTRRPTFPLDLAAVEAVCRAVPLPDAPRPRHRGHAASRSPGPQRLAELTGAPLVVVEGADHMIPGRHPVLANLLIRDFVRSLEEGATA